MQQYGWAIGVGIIFADGLLAKQRETDRLAQPPS